MERTTAERIAKRFVSLPVEQRKQILDKMIESGQSFRLLPIVATRQDFERIPLSYAQQRLFFLWQMEPQSSFYNVPMAVRLTGHLDDQAMARALELLVQRHEALRTRFASVEGEFYQDIQADSPVTLDIQSFSERPSEQALQALVREELAQPFDLLNGPVLRARLLHLGEAEHLLTLCMHHIVSDGWSSELVVAEFVQLYTALKEGLDATLPELPVQYADYAIWQRGWLEAGEGARQLEYWKQQLGDEQPVLDLPLDHERPASPSYRGAVVGADIPAALADELRALARKSGHTLFVLVLAAVSLVLSRYSGQADIRIGAPNASRNRAELEGLIGFFINTQVLRVQVDERATFAELIDQVREVVTGAQSHQDLPFEQLVDALLPERNLGHNPLFQFKINQNVQATGNGAARLGGVAVEAFALGDADARFDLAFDFTDTPEGIEAGFTYATDLFEASTIERMAASLLVTLEALVREPGAGLLEHAEQATGVIQTIQQPFACGHFIELWQRGLALAGQGQALRAGAHQLSYVQLERDSNRLAHYLRSLGVGSGSVVALCQERSVEWATAMLAVLKAGGVYLPLDSQQPAERLQQLLRNSGAEVLIHEAQDARFIDVPGVKVQAWSPYVWAQHSEQAPLQSFAPEQPAYLVYTSGSSGQPKGVEVSHKALANYVQAVLERLQLSPGGSMAMVSTVAADLGHTMLFGALASGRLLHLLPQELAFDPDGFAAYMSEHQVAVLKLVPSHLQGLLQASQPADVLPAQLLVLGGESSAWELVDKVRQLRPGCRVVNHYGPTETTVGVLTHEVQQRLSDHRSVPVGTLLANGRAQILDAWLNPVASQVAGELYLGGQGLAQGYRGHPALTAERFVPAADGARWYRTGDRARLRADGLVEFIGRVDDQVKIRGYRVEPGEISQLLLGVQGVKEAVVLPVPLEGDPARLQLVAWCSVETGFTASDLQHILQDRLPDYMVPAQIILLDRLPLTANGKLDKRALPKPGAVTQGYVAPQGEVEQKLADVWAQVLKREQIGTTDNFFELGGDSILSLQIIARAKRQGIKLTPKQVFEQQTIGQLAKVAKLIEAKPPAAKPVSETQERTALVTLSAEQLASLPLPAEQIEDIYPLSPMQQGMFFHSLLDRDAGHYINQLRVDVQGLDVERFKAAWLAAISRHEALRANFVEVDGPLQIIRKRVDAPCAVLDWRTEDNAEQKLDALALEDRRKGFDLAHDPMLRLTLIRTADDTHHLIHTTHHILLDGWSNSQLMGEILQSYVGNTPAPATSQYRDYIEWLGKQDAAASEAFWKTQLADLQEPTLLSKSIRQLDLQGDSGYGFHSLVLDKQQTDALSAFAQGQRVTLNTLVQAAWILLLQRYTGQDSVACGVTVSGRPAELEGVEQQLGLFINTLPLIARPLPEQRVGEWLQALQAQNLALREYEHTPLYDVQRWAGKSGEALFDSLLVFENYPISQALEKGAAHGLIFEGLSDHGQTNYALSVAAELADVLAISFSYNRGDWCEKDIAALAEGFERFLSGLSASPNAYLGELTTLTPAEHQQITQKWNASGVDFAHALSVHTLVQQQALQQPHSTALVFAGQTLSYVELNRQANRLARRLCELGAGPDVPIGLCVEQSLNRVIALLAILKSGSAYVPLDPGYPQDRLTYMIGDSGIRLLLTDQSRTQGLSIPEGVRVVNLEAEASRLEGYACTDLPDCAVPENLAYIIYTSGSTGRPKGVEVSRAALLNHMLWMKSLFNTDAADRVLQKTPFSFDASVWEFWLPLISGARLHLASPGLAGDFSRLWEEVQQGEITILQMVPSLLDATLAFATPRSLASLKYICCGGEALTRELVADIFNVWEGQLVNLYGPTEATIDACYHCVLPDVNETQAPVVGRPIANVRAYILGLNGPCAVDMPGELFIAGDSLARGYHQQPALTAERFVPDPFDTQGKGGGRLYRTGDRARYTPAGEIDFMGRVDHQLKIRGVRIEPEEIEHVLKRHALVKRAVVVAAKVAGATQLVAYLVPVEARCITSADEQKNLLQSIRTHLQGALPVHRLVEQIVLLPELPLTPSGKLDRQSLTNRTGQAPIASKVLLRTRLERQLASVWQEVLGIEEVGLHDDFFALGGHSILLLVALKKIREQVDESFAMHDFLQNPTIELQANVVRDRLQARHSSLVKLNTHPGGRPTIFCLPPAGGTTFPYYPLARALNDTCPVYALLHRGFIEKGFHYRSWEEMAQAYLEEIIQAQPEGPYNLLGWSSGGALAIEVASRLEAMGKTVNLLALVESMMPEQLALKYRAAVDGQPPVDLAALDQRNEAAMIMVRGFFPALDEATIMETIQEGRKAGVQDDSLMAFMMSRFNTAGQTTSDGLNDVYDVYATEAEFAVGYNIYENVANLARSFALRPLQVRPEIWWSSVSRTDLEGLEKEVINGCSLSSVAGSERMAVSHESIIYAPEFLASLKLRLARYLG